MLALSALGVVALTGCESVEDLARLGYPVMASDRAPVMHDLWIGTWIAAAVVGVGVWGLILYAAVRYRRRNADAPKQKRYNLPMEIFYSIAPFVVIGVLFYYTVLAQDQVLAPVQKPDHVVKVVGQKWSWTFNYNEADNPAVGENVWEAGTVNHSPDLYLPVGQSVRFELSSPDVIHSFWIPSFAFKRDVIPGRTSSFDVTPTREGVYAGKCAELCGTYHSAMIFNVHVVSEAEYNAYLKGLAERGNIGEALGNESANKNGPAIPEAGGAR
ncbi:cytochrome c oxidase subunit II [Microlunatus sp. GCM10028923]|uniref:aa3-type cytochrome oxidase subunit II n=1 Tax=Microlunatus sp. GCM10028923 TaxID=3273400 RepID=UPI003616C2F8